MISFRRRKVERMGSQLQWGEDPAKTPNPGFKEKEAEADKASE
jgi:hypothetical protein